MACEQFSDTLLVRSIHYGPEKTNANRLDLQIAEAIDHLHDCVFIKRYNDASLRIDPFGDGERIPPRNIRLWIRHSEVERLDPPSLADDKNVWVTFRGNESSFRGIARQDGINRAGRPVNEHLRSPEE